MKPVIVHNTPLGSIIMTRYPTSRKVVPSKLQRDKANCELLTTWARATIALHKAFRPEVDVVESL